MANRDDIIKTANEAYKYRTGFIKLLEAVTIKSIYCPYTPEGKLPCPAGHKARYKKSCRECIKDWALGEDKTK